MKQDSKWMQYALDLALKGWGQTNPNPLVGCVIVKNGRILAGNCHARLGQEHAERAAINQAWERGIDVRGARLYVNLEPCSHYGRTPPCTDIIIEAGISEVVVAMTDPNPLVAGKGIDVLRQAGITVRTGVMEAEARQLNEIFIKYILTRKPFVLLKAAISLDGKIATRTGDSRWVSGEQSRSVVHHWRDRVAGIMVGSQTVLKDNPSLNTRISGQTGNNPVRIIVDSLGQVPLESKAFHGGVDTGVILATTSRINRDRKAAYEALGVQVMQLDGHDGRVDLPALVDELGQNGLDSVMLEGGGTLNAAFLQARLVDKLMLFMAPKLIGGSQAVSCFDGLGIGRMAQAIQVDRMSMTTCGNDWLIEGYPCYTWGGKHVYRSC